MAELVEQSPPANLLRSGGMPAPDRISPRTPGQPFLLRLPVGIRQNIYRLSGVVQPFPISLNREVTFRAKWYHEHNVAFPAKLFRVCRIIHDEVTSIAYSENSFSIFHTHPSGFLGFYALNAQAKASLRSLTVGLCFRSHDMLYEVSHDWTYKSNDRRLEEREDEHWKSNVRYGTMSSGTALDAWNRLVRTMTMTVTASQLALDVICDVEDHEAAESLVNQIYRLPSLRKCAIRLSHSPDPYLPSVAEKAVLYATGQFHTPTLSGKPFRFLDLPAEIQRLILCHTDLVCPTDYHVGRGGSFSTSARWFDSCCTRCSDTKEACHCFVSCAAFSTWICDCWRPPTSLFLVNRLFNEYATEIFMSNVFRVHDDIYNRKWSQKSPVAFLRSLTAAQIKSCRKIIFNFEGLEIDEDDIESFSKTNDSF